MKGIMVPLLVLVTTGIVVGQQPLRPNKNESTSVEKNLSPVDSNREVVDVPVSRKTFASTAAQQQGLLRRPVPDDGPEEDTDGQPPEFTTTRQQQGGETSKFRPLSVPVKTEHLEQILSDAEKVLTVPVQYRSSSTNQVVSKDFITGVILEHQDNSNRSGIGYVEIEGVPRYDFETEKSVIRFELTDDQIRNMENNRLRYLFPDGDRGKYDVAEFVSKSAIDRARGQNANAGQNLRDTIADTNLANTDRRFNDGGMTSIPKPGPAPGDLDFTGPTNPFSRSNHRSNDLVAQPPASGNNEFSPGGNRTPMDRSRFIPGFNQRDAQSRVSSLIERPTAGASNRQGNLPLAGNYPSPHSSGQLQREMTIAEREEYLRQQAALRIQKENEQLKADLAQMKQQNAQMRTASRTGEPFGNRRSDFEPPATQVNPTTGVSQNVLNYIEKLESGIRERDQYIEDRDKIGRQQQMAANPVKSGYIQDPLAAKQELRKVNYQRPATPALGIDGQLNATGPAARIADRDPGNPILDSQGKLSELMKDRAGQNKEDQPKSNEEEVAPARTSQGQMQAMFMLFLLSLGLNIYLAVLSRSFYARYNELGEELRETFTRGV
ncbi:MAG: hypothetical protein AAFN77_04300 [Planctomycetota bacterium]